MGQVLTQAARHSDPDVRTDAADVARVAAATSGVRRIRVTGVGVAAET